MKMDASKFKKVSSDKHKTVLLHPRGHQIIIAHKALDKSTLDGLDKIAPMYQDQDSIFSKGPIRKMSEGGVASKDSDVFENNSKATRQRYVNNMNENDKNEAQKRGLQSELPSYPKAASYEDESDKNLNQERDLRPISIYSPYWDDVSSEDVQAKSGGGSVRRYAEGDEVLPQAAPDFAGITAEDINSDNPAYRKPSSMQMEQDASGKQLRISPVQQAAINAAPLPKEQESIPENQSMLGSYVGAQYPQSAAQEMKPYPAYNIPAGGANDPYAVANKTALQGIQKQQQGAQQLAAAQGELGHQEAVAHAMAANALNNLNANFQKSLGDLSNERQALYSDWQNGHIDPKHYVNNMSTGAKIGTAIGLIAGGYNAGMGHGPNLALDFLNKQIDRDIDAQKTNLNQSNNLFKLNLDATSNLQTASQLTKMNILDINSMHLKQLAANAQDPVQKANLLNTSGQLDIAASNIQQQIATREALMQSNEMGGEQGFQHRQKILKIMGQEKLSEAEEKRHVPGVGVASREVPDSIMKELASRQDLDNKIKDLDNFAAQHSGSVNPSIVAQGKAKASLVQDAVRQANAQGVFKESEQNFMSGIIHDDPTQLFNKYRARKGYQEASRSNLSSLNSQKKAYGLPITQEQAQGAQGTPNIQMHGGKPYMKVPGGWKLVK